MNAVEIRKHLNLKNYNTEITKEEYETFFRKTKESIRFTFNGWDGKSYDGESRNARVIRCSIPGFEEVRLVKVGKHLCYIAEGREILEKETGETHPEAEWLIEVSR